MRALILTATALLCFGSPTLAASSKVCQGQAIAQKGRVTSVECACKLKAAGKYLSEADEAYLVQYWSGQTSTQPHIYLGRAYPSGKNKPLIKYSAYVAKQC